MSDADRLPGVYPARRKDGTEYYRSSLTYKGKHISLGSFDTPEAANSAYEEGSSILREDLGVTVLDYDEKRVLSFDKWVALINLRDNKIYCRGPIYLRNKYFDYYLDRDTILRFDASELFYYTHHSIQRRGGHLFVADYGMQTNILNRYGIRSFAVCGRDYEFKNGDRYDFRSGNVIIINQYNGVQCDNMQSKNAYTTRIHVNGDLVVGHYDNEIDAAIAYNKAADVLEASGVRGNFNRNYIDGLRDIEYRLRYEKVRIRIQTHNS